MADKKISALTSASTPLAGTEVFPLVQSGSTVKTPVSSVITSNLTASFGAVTATVSGIPAITAIRDLDVGVVGDAGQTIAMGARNGATPIAGTDILGTLEVGGVTGRFAVRTLTSGTMSTKFTVSSAGDVTANIGNVVIGTAAKGIDFSANTGTAGMTSELLDWYEEGTWTGALACGTSGTITLSASFNTGSYTRVGRLVTVTGLFLVDSVSSPVGILNLTGLPYAISSGGTFARTAASVFAFDLAATAITSIVGRGLAGESQIQLYKYSAGAISNLAGDVIAGSQFYVSMSYITA